MPESFQVRKLAATASSFFVCLEVAHGSVDFGGVYFR